MTWEIREGDVLDRLREMPDESVHCVVTSPPYWGLRDYGVAGQLGLEATPDAYIARMVDVFREVRRVLRHDGTLWLNIGDSYASDTKGSGGASEKQLSNAGSRYEMSQRLIHGLKPKDLVGIPWRLAFALQADGWWLRSEIIWAKPNPMPESVTDRPTKAHEYVFLLTKAARYYYDADAIREPAAYPDDDRKARAIESQKRFPTADVAGIRGGSATYPARNARTVWSIATQAFSGAHFATFPEELPRRCILAGTSERGVCPDCGAPWGRVVERGEPTGRRDCSPPDVGGVDMGMWGGRAGERISTTTGWTPTCAHGGEPVPAVVLDPFAGSGTTLMVAARHGRSGLGIELNPEYAEMARRRIVADAPLFNAPVLPLEAAR